MSADWRNKQAILQDLAIAQGIVPVESVETLASNEKPPSLHIEEETEEQFIRQYVVDGTSTVTPDIGLIQDMLDMVRDVRVNDIEHTEDGAKSSEEETKNKSPQKSAKVDNTKRNRNVAVESILNQQELGRCKNKRPVILNVESMFKPKRKSTSTNTNNESVVSVSKESRTTVSKPGVFVPTNQAQEYYNKLVETKRQREMREETIWTRAERQMREIEERWKSKAAN